MLISINIPINDSSQIIKRQRILTPTVKCGSIFTHPPVQMTKFCMIRLSIGDATVSITINFWDRVKIPSTSSYATCLSNQSFPLVIYLFVKYYRQPEKGLIANTNLGGNNAARGAILGALLGAVNGFENLPERWIKGLLHPPEDFGFNDSATWLKWSQQHL